MTAPSGVTGVMAAARSALSLALARRRLRSVDVGLVVSTGRTGTKFFETLFADHPEVVCRHEPSPDLFDVGMAKYRLAESDTRADIVRHRHQPVVEARAAGRLYLESNPFLSLLIADLAEVFPRARFLWVVRDPATYVGSAYSKSPDRSGVMRFYADDDHRPRLRATDLVGDPHADAWTGFDRFERICWYWNACNGLIDDQLSELDPCRSLTVRFEDLFGSAGEDTLTRVADFFRTTLTEKQIARGARPVNTNPDDLLGAPDGWTPRQRDRCNTLTAPLRTVLGYPAV